MVSSYWTIRVYSYGPTVRVWSDRTSIRIRSGPYAYGPNTHMVWNIYTMNFIHQIYKYRWILPFWRTPKRWCIACALSLKKNPIFYLGYVWIPLMTSWVHSGHTMCTQDPSYSSYLQDGCIYLVHAAYLRVKFW